MYSTARLLYVIIYIIILTYHHAATCCCDRKEMPFHDFAEQIIATTVMGPTQDKKTANIKYHLQGREAKYAALSSLLILCVLAPYTSLVSVSSNSHHEVTFHMRIKKSFKYHIINWKE